MSICPEQGGPLMAVEAHLCHFHGEKPGLWERNAAQEFDYGYALTCHKAQGSEWSSVIVYNERLGSKSDQWKWLYTAVTRASERVHLVT
jgi:exodeoxyribonuclease-5